MKLETWINRGTIAAVVLAAGLCAKNCKDPDSATAEAQQPLTEVAPNPVLEDTESWRGAIRSIFGAEPTPEELLEECKAIQAEAQEIVAMEDPVGFMEAMVNLRACKDRLSEDQAKEWINLEDSVLKAKKSHVGRCQSTGEEFDPDLLEACETFEEASIAILADSLGRQFETIIEPSYKADFETTIEGSTISPGYYFVLERSDGSVQEVINISFTFNEEIGEKVYSIKPFTMDGAPNDAPGIIAPSFAALTKAMVKIYASLQEEDQ